LLLYFEADIEADFDGLATFAWSFGRHTNSNSDRDRALKTMLLCLLEEVAAPNVTAEYNKVIILSTILTRQ